MKKTIFILLLGALLAGCTGSASYDEGKQMAGKTYGAMAPTEMMGKVDTIMERVQSEMEKTDNKKDWWKGFCDRGEEIWLERVDQINEAIGAQVLNQGQIESMFGQMRSSFRE